MAPTPKRALFFHGAHDRRSIARFMGSLIKYGGLGIEVIPNTGKVSKTDTCVSS